jgi:acyl-[acyl-carrier-protein]-phospholipid O-acyltransferase/long-chain-fatty-acid--[acyl-carrier-protein] ligase
VKVGAWGVVASLSGLAAVGSTAGVTLVRSTPVSSASSKEPKSTGAESAAQDDGVATAPAGESLVVMLRPTSLFEVICRVLLTSVGFFAGLFYVPLAVVMQVRPPADKKGRMIGAMNLVNWIFILIAAGFYLAVIAVCSSLQIRVSWIFVLCAAVMLPVALFYRPSIELQGEAA